MTPYLVTPPAVLPVALSDMKLHLRVSHNDDDADIEQKQKGAVAMLDGYGGILCRCIMPQTWAVDVIGPGPHVLPFPDATGIAAVSGTDPLAVTVARTAMGQAVTVTDAASDQPVTISAVYGLPAPRLAAAQSLVKMMVQREFDMLAGNDYGAITQTINYHINTLRWGRV
jgi:hypothetical protein